jgi:hypothetical protein
MTFKVFDHRTGHRVVVTLPKRQRLTARARRWVLQELDRTAPDSGPHHD